MHKTLNKVILAASVACPLGAQAAGLYLYEIGTSDLGFAAAGTAARAEDASTLFANPAGMTRLAGNQMMLGAQVLYGDADYELDGQGALPWQGPGQCRRLAARGQRVLQKLSRVSQWTHSDERHSYIVIKSTNQTINIVHIFTNDKANPQQTDAYNAVKLAPIS